MSECDNGGINSYVEICESAFKKYLHAILSAPHSVGKEENILSMYRLHMQELGQFMQNGLVASSGFLNQKLILDLHKKCYPPNYVGKEKTAGGYLITLVPGTYKIYSQNNGEFIAMEPNKVKQAMKKIIIDCNVCISESSGKAFKPERFLHFLYQFFYIHPFANANGRVGSILLDSILLYIGYPPIKFKERYDQDDEIRSSIKKAIRDRSFEKFVKILQSL